MEARHGGAGRYLLTTSDGDSKELSASEVHEAGVEIICNPFFTRLWPQNQDNMTLIPVKFACTFPRAHSWRRMLLTSPPITYLSMSLWYVNTMSFPYNLSYQSPTTDTCQVHEAQRRRVAASAIHRPRSLRRDTRTLRRHAGGAAQEAGVSLDAATRLRFLVALRRHHFAATKSRRQGAPYRVSRRLCQPEQWYSVPRWIWEGLAPALLNFRWELRGRAMEL